MAIFILGRQSGIGLAELEALYGSDCVTPIGNIAARVSKDVGSKAFERIGGSIKVCKELTPLPSGDWRTIEKYLVEQMPGHVGLIAEGKIKLGISVFGSSISPAKIQASALAIKKAIKKSGRSVRIIPNQATSLNAAQILRNKLTDELGMELNVIITRNKSLLCQTIAVQNIDSYTERDFHRPKRDAKVGMLPPKLAQTITNLAIGQEHPNKDFVVLDPFCGTGVVLQEALLMGYGAYGSDLEQRMIDYTNVNLGWLDERFDVAAIKKPPLQVADATDHTWDHPFDTIACETYLGRPFSALPAVQMLHDVRGQVNVITTKFLQNIAKQTKPGFRLCIAVPAWHVKNSILHLPVLDSLHNLGYNRVSFAHASNQELIYHRQDQIVGRELVTLIRK